MLVIIWYFYLFGSFNQTVQRLANKYGPNPKANTNDYIQTINSANNNDIICTNNNNHQAFEFLLKYRNPANKSLTDNQRKFYEDQLLKTKSQLKQEKKQLLEKFRR